MGTIPHGLAVAIAVIGDVPIATVIGFALCGCRVLIVSPMKAMVGLIEDLLGRWIH